MSERRHAPFRKMVVGISVFGAVSVVAIIGYLIAGWGLADALYMVVISAFGVGYGEVRPIDSWPLRGLTMAVIVAGYGAVIYVVGGFIQMVVDGELNNALGARRMTRDIDALQGHTIICGFGRTGNALAKELAAAGHPFVAIDTQGGVDGESDHLVLHGDATEEEILIRAGIERAAVVATVMSDDALNVFVTVTAREMNPGVRIIARGENRRTESKLRSCGADTVVMPTAIGATTISQMITAREADERLDYFLGGADAGLELLNIGLQAEELVIAADSPLVGRTLAEIETAGAHGYLIVGIRFADGTTLMHPPTSTPVGAGDGIVVLGYHDDIPRMSTRAPAPRPVTYRGVTQA